MVHETAQIQLPNHTPQIHLALPRRDRRADCVGEFVKRSASVQPRFFVEECDRCRVPLAGNQTAGVHGSLTLRIIVCISSGEGDDQEDDFSREMDLAGRGRMHGGQA